MFCCFVTFFLYKLQETSNYFQLFQEKTIFTFSRVPITRQQLQQEEEHENKHTFEIISCYPNEHTYFLNPIYNFRRRYLILFSYVCSLSYYQWSNSH